MIKLKNYWFWGRNLELNSKLICCFPSYKIERLFSLGSPEAAWCRCVIAESDVEAARQVLAVLLDTTRSVNASNKQNVEYSPEQLDEEWNIAAELVHEVRNKPVDEQVEEGCSHVFFFQSEVLAVWVAEERLVVKDEHLDHVASSGHSLAVPRKSISGGVNKLFWVAAQVDQIWQKGPENDPFGWSHERANQEVGRNGEPLGLFRVSIVKRLLDDVKETDLQNP